MAIPSQAGKAGSVQSRLVFGIVALALLGGGLALTLVSIHSGISPKPEPVQVDSGQHPTGLVMPTPAQHAADQAPPVTDVQLNPIALERINADRKAKGLPPITLPTVAPGHETDAATNSPASKNP